MDEMDEFVPQIKREKTSIRKSRRNILLLQDIHHLIKIYGAYNPTDDENPEYYEYQYVHTSQPTLNY